MLQNDTKSLVPAAYFKMFSLRLLGLTYSQIAEKTGYSEVHVRRLFAKGGQLQGLWLDFQKDAIENGVEESKDMLFGHLPDVVRSLIMLAKSNKPGAVRAAGIIMDYTLGKPPEYKIPQNLNKNEPFWLRG